MITGTKKKHTRVGEFGAFFFGKFGTFLSCFVVQALGSCRDVNMQFLSIIKLVNSELQAW